MTPNEELVVQLMRAFPELSRLLEEHLEEQDGELLPYLLMADIERWSESAIAHDADRVAEHLVWLEREFASASQDVKDLIGVGYVEMLPHTPEGDPLLNLLGPELRQVATDMGLFAPAEGAGPAPRDGE